ncbi:hypothetical protein M758_7G174700 [Ceratodon purpureus]|uniref:Uncharacterized protein n=1 Tax=Ceratodon purpureus TaxID=3225 RepID=A0A8T0H7T3_CERPU|nr:hypothetical protein KC19_7G177800 [Ceratodon purpureus]KAG0611902.1 hypothetical protein M758_7G174700 [Ceratodon purpureus]
MTDLVSYQPSEQHNGLYFSRIFSAFNGAGHLRYPGQKYLRTGCLQIITISGINLTR